MSSIIESKSIETVFAQALTKGIVGGKDASTIFYDLTYLTARIQNVIEAFPSLAFHTIAVKANPLLKILKYMSRSDVGLEVVSSAELRLALEAGFPPEKIVLDSPVKTIPELQYALDLGVHINADNFQELARIAQLMENNSFKSSIGVRINPQVGTGKILSTSVAGEYSKFGIALNTNRRQLIECFKKYHWLKSVHVHIGSQIYNVELLIKGIEKIFEFINEVNSKLDSRQIEIFDIGGGFPVSYHKNENIMSMSEYADRIKTRCPLLFDNKFKIITEFGRYIHANSGWTASRVEYVKQGTNMDTVMIHVGADLFLRKCYNPDDWHHEITVADKTGKIRTGNTKTYTIAGPLCFSGDMIATGIQLPIIEQGDYILIQDTGAYTLSMWSRYNSREIPKVIGYEHKNDKNISFSILKEKENLEDILRFWS